GGVPPRGAGRPRPAVAGVVRPGVALVPAPPGAGELRLQQRHGLEPERPALRRGPGSRAGGARPAARVAAHALRRDRRAALSGDRAPRAGPAAADRPLGPAARGAGGGAGTPPPGGVRRTVRPLPRPLDAGAAGRPGG